MASTKGRSKSASSGGQPGQSRLLQLLRRHGFAEELPPSTVSWLDTRPVFRWLADHLGDDNFVSRETQELYDLIQAREQSSSGGGGGGGSGPADADTVADLISAIGIASSPDGSSGDGSGSGSPGTPDSAAGGVAGEGLGTEELEAAIEEEQAHKELLQQQLATLGAASRRLATAAGGAARASEQQRRGIAGALRAASLRAAQAAAADAAHELECELQQLGRALTEWAELAEGSAPPGAEWLLATADASGYAARDAEAQELISRGMQLVSAAAGIAPPPGVGDGLDDAGSGSDDDAPIDASASKQSSALQRRRGDARRWRDQERRNKGLQEELARQRVAFKAAYDQHLAALVARAGAEGALTAVEGLIAAEQRHARTGAGSSGARLAQVAALVEPGGTTATVPSSESADAIVAQAPQLRREAETLERERTALQEQQLPALHAALARLNDTHVLEGDYERQLAKMRVAHTRKRALIDALLDAAARHAALRGVQARELAAVRELQGAAEAARRVLQAFAAAAAAREGGYSAVAGSAAATSGRASLTADDAYMSALAQVVQPGGADWAAVHNGAEGGAAAGPGAGAGADVRLTPRGAGAASLTPQSSHAGGAGAPLLAPRSGRPQGSGSTAGKEAAAGLEALAAALRSGEAALREGLFGELPRRLSEVLAAERSLRRLAFPGGGGGGGCGGGRGGVDGDGATAPGGAGPEPLLTSAELSGAMRELEGLNQQLGAAINRLLQQQGDWASVARQQAREQALERRVHALMFTQPAQLSVAVGELRAHVAGLEAAAGVRGGG